MSKRSYITDEKGRVVGIKETSNNGKRSYTYENNGSIFFDNRGKCVDITDHHEDGTSTSYEHNGNIFFDPRGKRK